MEGHGGHLGPASSSHSQAGAQGCQATQGLRGFGKGRQAGVSVSVSVSGSSLPHSPLPRGKRRAMEAQMQSEALSLLSNLADLANAVHWLPRGVLWAGRFPPWLVGLMGTISSILSMYQAARAGGQAEATTP